MDNQKLDIHHLFAEFFQDERIRPFAYLLSKRLQEGHVCISEDAVLTDTGSPYGTLKKLPDFSRMKKMVTVLENDPPAPFVYQHKRLYLQRYYHYETYIVDKIRQLVLLKSESFEERKKQVLSLKKQLLDLSPGYSLEGLSPNEKTDWQLVSVIQCLLNDFSIITGGPGTGKTTTLANLLFLLLTLDPAARIALAAPTGKASMRMLQSLSEKSARFPEEIRAKMNAIRSSTIHALLGTNRNSIYFKHNETEKLAYDWIIVDEASMIDMPLFAKLLMALGTGTRLVLLGDKDQLASVEAGSLLGDLCESLPRLNRFHTEHLQWVNQFIADPERQIYQSSAYLPEEQPALLDEAIVELTLSHRFKERGLIGQLSKAVIQNDRTAVEFFMQQPAHPELTFISVADPAALRNFIRGYGAFLTEPDIRLALQKLNQLRVLVAVRHGDSGLYALNRQIEKMLEEEFASSFSVNEEFYYNRPVMVTRNNYELGLYNGDVGIIRPDEQNRLRAWFPADQTEEGIRPVLPAYLSGAETVFAMTIHKSQGSEFDQVMVVLPEQADHRLLTRELIYTGITRARFGVVIQGAADVVLSGISKSVERSSGIQDRLNETS